MERMSFIHSIIKVFEILILKSSSGTNDAKRFSNHWIISNREPLVHYPRQSFNFFPI